MMPPNAQTQQAMLMQRALQKPQDPLLAALQHQAMMGEVLKATADHKLKMLKLKQKYQSQMGPMGPQGQGPAPMGPSPMAGQGGY